MEIRPKVISKKIRPCFWLPHLEHPSRTNLENYVSQINPNGFEPEDCSSGAYIIRSHQPLDRGSQ